MCHWMRVRGVKWAARWSVRCSFLLEYKVVLHSPIIVFLTDTHPSAFGWCLSHVPLPASRYSNLSSFIFLFLLLRLRSKHILLESSEKPCMSTWRCRGKVSQQVWARCQVMVTLDCDAHVPACDQRPYTSGLGIPISAVTWLSILCLLPSLSAYSVAIAYTTLCLMLDDDGSWSCWDFGHSIQCGTLVSDAVYRRQATYRIIWLLCKFVCSQSFFFLAIYSSNWCLIIFPFFKY